MLALPAPEQLQQQLEQDLQQDLQTQTAAKPASAATWLEDLLQQPSQSQREAIDQLGLGLQQQARQQSELLQTPLAELAATAEEGGPVAQLLEQLQKKMQVLDPNQRELKATGLQAWLTKLPGFPSPMKSYFRQFETAQQALNQIIQQLEGGQERLKRDNITLAADQKVLKETLVELAEQVAFARALDALLQQRAETAEEELRSWLENELLFPLRQRILDLQQQQSVCQQGVLAQEILIRNNRELIRGVDRALNVTLSALQVAVTVALALSNQKLVLDQITALNQTTNQLLAGTAQQLRQQGTHIQKQASQTLVDLDTLEQAFEDSLGALDELRNYRRDALPLLTEQIDRLAQLNAQADKHQH